MLEIGSPQDHKSEPVPEIPKKSELASKYPRLTDVCHKLKKQNTSFYEREQQLAYVEQGYGYKNVKAFPGEYRTAKAEYTDYQSAFVKWEQQTEPPQ